MVRDLEKERWSILTSMLTEFPEMRSPALRFILGLRKPLAPAQVTAVEWGLKPVHDELGRALDSLGDKGLTAKADFSAQKGYLLVLLEPASREEVKPVDD
jgi:hypothetical protein